MPPKGFVDGPTCGNPVAVADAWAETSMMKERLRVVQTLILDNQDPDASAVQPTRANMIHNAEILLVLASDMSKRRRAGADPIDVICQMTMAFYEKHPAYSQVLKEKFNLKAVAYNHAWVLHKMMSRIRNSVPKHATSRVPCLAKK